MVILRVSNSKADSDLDSIRNSCDVSFVFCSTSRRVVDAMLSVICAGTSWRRTGPQAEIYFLQQAERARHLGWSADTKTKTMLYFLQPIVSILDLGLPLAYSIILLYILFLKFRFSGKDLISAQSRGFLMQFLPGIKNLCNILMQFSSKK